MGPSQKKKPLSLRRRIRSVALFSQLGPGLVTGAADDDPSGVATYSQAGAKFGFSLLWSLLLTYPLMSAIQLVSARIGRVTGQGLTTNLTKVLPRPLVLVLIGLLFFANTINLGADLAAMGASAELVLGFGAHVFTLAFALISLGLQLFIPYRRYAKILKWLTLVLLAYVAVIFMVRLDWRQVGEGLVVPRFNGSRDQITTIVAILGTTISPYLFFWQSAQEVEEVAQDPKAKPLKEAPKQADKEIKRIRIDTWVGMAISNLIAMAIVISAAATLHASGHTEVKSAADAASALRPAAGPFAFALFSLGIIGTGLLAIPVLAGSAAYAIGDACGWKCSLENKPWEAVGFYSVIGAATLLGVAIDWARIDAMQALFWSAVVNGVIAGPMMAVMMLAVSRKEIVGKFKPPLATLILGWGATFAMAAATIALVVTSLAPGP